MAIRKWAVMTLMCLAATMPAYTDTKTEEYIRVNVNAVFAALNAPEMTTEDRQAQFRIYMDVFTDFDAISRFVIGKYAKRFSPDDLERYTEAFRSYSLTVYEYYFNAYRDREITIIGSTDRNDRDSIVNTLVQRTDGKEVEVRWRVLNRNGRYRVVDVALSRDGNLIWLAIEQQAQFLSILDQSNGSVEALITRINKMKANVHARQKKEAQSAPEAG